MNAPIQSIKRVLGYLMKLKLKETLGNAAMTLLSPIPALYNFIMRADWSDMKDIDRTIDMMTKLVEDITTNAKKFVSIPKEDKEKVSQLLADLNATKTTAKKEETLRALPGDPLLDLEQYRSMFDRLAEMLGMNYKLANGLLPLVQYKSVDKATYDGSDNKVAVFKSPISGTINFFDIYIIGEPIAPGKFEERSNARRSNIGLVLYLMIKHSVTTLPAALFSIVPAGIWVGINSILESRAANHQAELAEAKTGLPNLMSELYFDLDNLPLNTQIKKITPDVDDRDRDRNEYANPEDQYNKSEYDSTLKEIKKLIGTAEKGTIEDGSIDVDSPNTELLLAQYKRLKQYQKTLRALSDNKDAISWYTAIKSGLKTAGNAVASPVAAAGTIIASPVYALYFMFSNTPDYITKQINAYTNLAATFFKWGSEDFMNWEPIKETAKDSFERRDASVTSSAKSLFGLNEPLTSTEKELIEPGSSLDTLEKFNAKFNEFTSSILGKIYQEATEGTGKQIANVTDYIDKFEEVFGTANALQLMNTIKESVTKLYGTEVELNFFPVLNAFLKLAGIENKLSYKTSGFQLVGMGLLYLIHMPVDITVTSLSIGVGTGVAIAGAIPLKLIVTAIPILMKFFGDALTIVQTTLLIGKLVGGTIVYGGIVWPVSKLLLLFFTIAKVLRTIAIRPLLALFSRATMGINILRGVSKEETTDWYASLKTFQLIDKEGKFAPSRGRIVRYGETTLKDWEALAVFVSDWLQKNVKTFADFKVNYKEDAYAELVAAILAQDPKFIVKGDLIDTDEKAKTYLSMSMKRIEELTRPLKKPILTAVPTDTTIALRWTSENGVVYTLQQDDTIDLGVVTTQHNINRLKPDTLFSFKLTGTKGTKTIDSEKIDVRTLPLTTGPPSPPPPGPPPPPPPEEEEEKEEEKEEDSAATPPQGGNHTTRKQRVRGIFKNSKTRRTY